MNSPARGRVLPLVVLSVVLISVGCYDPPVAESVLVILEPDGRVTLSVETTFKQADTLKFAEKQEIQRVMDMYDLGRDPWLRGFEEAGATGISHECLGDPGNPRGISRRGVLPSLESIVLAMPDAIANFRLRRDAGRATVTLRILHIDIPESLRGNRRRIEREVEACARVGYRFSEAHCDLYDYLATRTERRHDLLQALDDEKHIEGLLTPGETILIGRLRAAFEELMGFGERTTPPVMAEMSFAPFEHGFCLRLPPGAEMMDSGGFVADGEVVEKSTWCAPRLTLEDLMDDAWPQADPKILDETILQDAERLTSAPFSCVRQADEKALVGSLWDRILPRSQYEITWKTGEPAP